MKILLLLTAFATLAMTSTSQAGLIAGWDTWTGVNTTNGGPDTLASGAAFNAVGVTGSALFPGQSGLENVWVASGTPNNTTGTFGTTYSGASAIGNALGDEGMYANPTPNTGNTLVDFTISYSGVGTLDLDTFHFDGSMGGGQTTRGWTLASISGAVTADPGVATGLFPGFNGVSELDLALTGLADRTLASGESATFRLSFIGNGNGGNGIRLDNVGFGGTIVAVPEPSSLALLGLAGVGVLVRRKKRA